MGTPTLPDIDLTGAAFDTANSELLTAGKADRVPALPAAAASRPISAWGNLIDNMARRLQRRTSRVYMSVIEHGATGDGVTDDSTAIQSAIDDVFAKGGGTVRLPPPATSYVGLASLTLRSNVRLHYSGIGDPNGSAWGTDGDKYERLDGAATDYVKTGGTGNTGWVVVTTATEDISQTLTQGQTITAGLGMEWQDAQGTPVTRAHEDYDDASSTWRRRYYSAAAALIATMSVSAVTGAMAYDGASVSLSNSNISQTLGDNLGSPESTYLKSETGVSRTNYLSVDGTPSAGDFRQEHSGDERFKLYYHDGLGWLETFTVVSDVDVRFGAAAGGAMTLGWGNQSTPANVTHTNYVGAAGQLFWGAHDGTNSFDGGVEYNTSSDQLFLYAANARRIVVNATQAKPDTDNQLTSGANAQRWVNVYGYAGTFTNSLTLDGASPVAIFGSGAGNPSLYMVAEAVAGVSIQYWMKTSTSAKLGDWRQVHTAAEALTIEYRDATAFRQVIGLNSDSSMALLSGSQSQAFITMGPTGTQSITQQFVKSDAGATSIIFYNIDATASDGDQKFVHLSGEALAWQRHDGTDWRDIIKATDDTNLTLLGGAQGPSLVTIGGTVAATDEAIIQLNAGSSGYPGFYFVDAGNRLEFSEGAQKYNTYINGALMFDVGVVTSTLATNLILSATSAVLRMGDGITAGSPDLRLRKGPTGNSFVSFYDTDESPTTGDVRLHHDTSLDFSLEFYSGGAWRDQLKVLADGSMTIHGGATGTQLLQFGVDTGGGHTADFRLGAFGGTSVLSIRKFASNVGRIDFLDTDGTLSDGDFRHEHTTGEDYAFQRHDGTSMREIWSASDDTAFQLLSGAQAGSWTVTIGPSATHVGGVIPGFDGGGDIGADTKRWRSAFFGTFAFGFLEQSTNVTLGRGETYLECASATQVITLPDAATLGKGHIYLLDLKTAHGSGSLKNSTGDTINDNDKSVTGQTLGAVGLYIAVSDGGTNWELHGPIARIDTAA